jgi:hypothetical protein
MRNMKLRCVASMLVFCLMAVSAKAQWHSSRVYFDGNGRLTYVADSAGNRIPDFSHAGYKGGGVSIPFIPVVKSVFPQAGDNTSRLQAAIDSVGALPADQNGFRGALLLAPGVYNVYGTIYVRTSGVILRGSGDGGDSLTSTIIYGRGDTPHQRTIIEAGGGSETLWRDSVAGSRTNVLTDSVLVGANSFRIEFPARFTVGDNIVLYHPCTDAWLQAIDYGGTDTSAGWSVGSQPIVFNRYITRISGDTITFDVPVFNTLVRSLSQSYIYKYTRSGLRTKIGIENLRVDIETAGGTDENHAWQAVELQQIEDAWMKKCTMIHFGQSGVMTHTATRITIDSCQALEPISIITGERRYNFNMYSGSQQILVSHCTTSYGRHDFVSNGTSWTSGCVFLDCVSIHTNASSEGHRRWTMGFLYDNIVFTAANTSTILGLYNRGSYGTSHGWGIAHSVLWNCDATGHNVLLQQPPTAQNYAIGCKGTVTGASPPAPFSHPQGYVEGTNRTGLNPRSLYLAQLEERLGVSSVGGERGQLLRPGKIHLGQNYPNPFNPSTIIRFGIPRSGSVTLRVYDVLGREVSVMERGLLSAGEYERTFDGAGLANGVYFYSLSSEGEVETRRMVLLK